VTRPPLAKRPFSLAILLIIGGAIGLFSSFELTVDKFRVLTNPQAELSCDMNFLVQCSTNLASSQGAVFGFPNPIIGLIAFTAPIVVGVAILAGAKFARWFWLLFTVGIALGFAFIIWLMSQSIFVLGTLCIWCMIVWAVTIPMFWTVTLFTLREGVIPSGTRARRMFAAAYSWVPFITLLSYLVIAVLAQLRLDVISLLF